MQLARLTLHEVLELPTAERMAYIAHTRLLKHQRRDRVSGKKQPSFGGSVGVDVILMWGKSS